MLKLSAKKDAQLIEVLVKAREARANLSRFEEVKVWRSGNFKADLKDGDPTRGGGKYLSILDETGAELTKAFLANGVPADKDSYDVVEMRAKSSYTFNGITYPEGNTKFVLR